MPTIGYKELDQKLRKMTAAAGGKALRSAAWTATLPALKGMKAAAPVGHPPYSYGPRISTGEKTAGKLESAKTIDPYPVKTYKGNLRTPGYAGRNISRKALVSRDKRTVIIMLAPRKEAFYAINFYEFGTSRNPPRPWFEPAFAASIPEVDVRFRTQLKRLIDKAAKS
jgi:HK97 gp10 family phage protein